MNNKSMAVLVVVILAMGIGIYLHQRGEVTTKDDMIGTAVFPKLASDLDKVQEVRFSSASQSVTIEHKDDHWTIAEKGGYEADFSKLSSFLDGLAKAKYVERKTSRPENFSVLGLAGIDNSSSKATEVTVTTSDGSEYQLLIGDSAEGEKGRFVRKPAESQAWLVDSVETASSEPVKWIEPVVFSLDEGQVQSVTDTTGDGKHSLTVTRDKDSNDFKVQDLPKGATLKYDTIADSLARSLENLRATDVRPRQESAWKDSPTASYELKDGSQLVCHAMKDPGGQYWLRFDLNPAKKPSEAVSFIDAGRLAGFEFRVPDYVYQGFTHTMDDMIKKEDAADKKVPSSTSG